MAMQQEERTRKWVEKLKNIVLLHKIKMD